MSQYGEGFFQYAMRMSQKHHETFTENSLTEEQIHFYKTLATQSHTEQKNIEQTDTLPFATFLQQYFSKSL